MQVSFFDVFVVVLSLTVLAVPGYILARFKMFPQKADEALSTLVLYGCQPIMMFVNFQKTAYRPEIATNMLLVAGLTLLIHLIMIGVVIFVLPAKKTDSRRNTKNVARVAAIFSNCGFIGLPFLQMLFPGQGEVLVYCGVVISVFNLLAWSVAIFMISGDKKEISIKKVLLNPVLVGIYVGLTVFLILRTPLVDIANGTIWDSVIEKLMGSFDFISNAITPLSMMVIGIRLANVNLKSLFANPLAYYSNFLKLVVLPIITTVVVAFLPIDNSVKYTLFFTLSMPSATISALFAIKYNSDGDFGSVSVLLSSLLSVVTIPVMYLFFELFCKIIK